jgi:hypothetical protein
MAAMRLRFGRNPPRTPMLPCRRWVVAAGVVTHLMIDIGIIIGIFSYAMFALSRVGHARHCEATARYLQTRHDQVPAESAPGRAEVRSCDKTSRSVLQKSSAARMSPLTDYTTRGRCRRARSRVPARVSVAAWLLCGVMLGWTACHMLPGVYFGRHAPIRGGFSRNRLVDPRGGRDSHIFLFGV